MNIEHWASAPPLSIGARQWPNCRLTTAICLSATLYLFGAQGCSGGNTGDSSAGDTSGGIGDPSASAGDTSPGAGDAATSTSLAPLSTLVCELLEPPGPIPQPPGTLVADFGQPIRLQLNDPCSQDAVEVSADGNRIYHTYSVNDINLLITEGRQIAGTEVRFQDRVGANSWGPPRVLGLRNGLPDSLNGETRVAPDRSWVIWHALDASAYGYVDGLPPENNGFDLDIYETTMVDDVPGAAVHIGRELNSAYYEGEHWATDDGRSIYFASNRPGGAGGVDIWKITRDALGAWGTAAVLPTPVNSTAKDMQPTISPDGKWIYFASERSGTLDIWRVAIDAGGSFAATAERVLSPYVGEPSLSNDGRLFFVHVEIDFTVAPPAVYDADIYYVAPQ